ncbi:MAG: M23 family metallopeptidase [Treponema sp.]|nr:M23 family metallopeptidase [Treponema sp.]
MKKNKFISLVIFSILFAGKITAQEQPPVVVVSEDRLPVLTTIKPKDPVFKEYSYIVSDNYKAIAQQKQPEMIFFKYTVEEKINLLSLAARCNIRYETIATLNKLDNQTDSLEGKELLLPTAPGLFIKKENASSSLEILLREHYLNEPIPEGTICYQFKDGEYYFLINKKLTPTERAYFLDAGLQLPLDRSSFWVSSSFGRRKNPFSGEWRNHNGVDLAAPTGTPIYAIKDGTVSLKQLNNKTFGNYVILSHDKGKMTSVYAHMSKVAVNLNDSVKKGQIIGYVGATGMATGPHLHFEIRQGGVPQDPEKALKI